MPPIICEPQILEKAVPQLTVRQLASANEFDAVILSSIGISDKFKFEKI